MALRAARTLLHRLPQPTDRQDVRAHGGTQHHDGPHTPVRPAHRPAPKSGGVRALGRPALPLQPGARPNGAQTAPPHPTHTPASTPPFSCFYSPTHGKKKSPFLDTVSPNLMYRTNYTHTICSFTDNTIPLEPSCRPFRSTYHRIYKTRHTTLTGKSLFGAPVNLYSSEPHPKIVRNG